MKRNLTSGEVVGAIEEGIVLAQEDYKRSAGDWISNAPEYLSTVMAYKSILCKMNILDKSLDSPSGYITLECTQDDIGKINRRGLNPRQSPITRKSRVDLLLWAASGHPRAVIEIKRDYKNRLGTIEDIKRIKVLLFRMEPKLAFGIFATIIYEEVGRGTIEEAFNSVWAEINNVKREVRNKAEGLSCQPHHIEPMRLNIKDDTGKQYTRIWCPLCFTFRLARKKRY